MCVVCVVVLLWLFLCSVWFLPKFLRLLKTVGAGGGAVSAVGHRWLNRKICSTKITVFGESVVRPACRETVGNTSSCTKRRPTGKLERDLVQGRGFSPAAMPVSRSRAEFKTKAEKLLKGKISNCSLSFGHRSTNARQSIHSNLKNIDTMKHLWSTQMIRSYV